MYPKINLISINLNEAALSVQTFICAFNSFYLYYFLHWYTVSFQPDCCTHHLFIYVVIYFMHINDINNINTIYIH